MFRHFKLTRAESSPGEFLLNYALAYIVIIHNFKVLVLITHRTNQNQSSCEAFSETGLKIDEQDVKPKQTKLCSVLKCFSSICIKQAYKVVTTQFIMFESKRRTYYNPHPFKARRLSFLKIFLVLPRDDMGHVGI